MLPIFFKVFFTRKYIKIFFNFFFIFYINISKRFENIKTVSVDFLFYFDKKPITNGLLVCVVFSLVFLSMFSF